jgi:hypothetical protein
MRQFVMTVSMLGLVAATAFADTTWVNVERMNLTPVNATSTSLGEHNGVEAMGIQVDSYAAPHAYYPTTVYDNIPTGAGGSQIVVPTTPTLIGFRWAAAGVGWGDDADFFSAPMAFRSIAWFYQNTGTAVSHTQTILIQTHAGGNFSSGPTHLTGIGPGIGIGVSGLPAGTWIVNVSLGTTIALPPSAWISFFDPSNTTFWVTGNTPGIGGSTNGTLYNPGGPTGYWVPGSFGTGFGLYYAVGNINMALGIPEPATIGLLVVGGLLSLRRRRA